MAAVEVEALRLPPSVLSVSVNTDRWKKQQLTVATEEVQAVEVTVAAVEVEDASTASFASVSVGGLAPMEVT